MAKLQPGSSGQLQIANNVSKLWYFSCEFSLDEPRVFSFTIGLDAEVRDRLTVLVRGSGGPAIKLVGPALEGTVQRSAS